MHSSANPDNGQIALKNQMLNRLFASPQIHGSLFDGKQDRLDFSGPRKLSLKHRGDFFRHGVDQNC